MKSSDKSTILDFYTREAKVILNLPGVCIVIKKKKVGKPVSLSQSKPDQESVSGKFYKRCFRLCSGV